MGSLVGTAGHDDVISNRQSHAGLLVQKWFDDMPAVPLELWSPTTIFEPLSPLAPASPFFLTFLRNKASSLSQDNLRRRPVSSGTGPYSPIPNLPTAPSSSLAAQG